MRKIFFLLKKASFSLRLRGLIALAVGVVFLLTVLFGAVSAINGSVTKLPILKLAYSETQLNEMEASAEKYAQEIEEAIEKEDPAQIEKFEKESGVSIEKLKKSFDPISLKSMITIFELEGDSSFAGMFGLFVKIITIYAVILVALLALAVLFMKKGLMILAYILALPFLFIFVGVTAFVICTVAMIAYCILIGKVNKAYKAYKKAPATEE